MKIKIDRKIAPFSKLCGTKVIIPKTTYAAIIFPAKIAFYNKEINASSSDLEVYFKIKGPIKNFEVFQNIEKSFIEVSGFSLEGFIRYKIEVIDGSIVIYFEKLPKDKIEILSSNDNKTYVIERKNRFALPLRTRVKEEVSLEKLSLGMNKAQDIELINRRGDLNEILPIWFALGQSIPQVKSNLEGVAFLLNKSEKLILEKRKEELEPLLKNIYLAGFSSVFFPSLIDERHQGIIDKSMNISKDSSPLILLEKGYEVIRSLFLFQDKNYIEILGCLLPMFHAGRMVNIALKSIGQIDIEWSKKLLKKMILHSEGSTIVRFKLQSSIKSFRIRHHLKDEGIKISSDEEIFIDKNRTYYFDRFRK